MQKTLSKIEVAKEIQEFFSDIKNKNPEQVRKIKLLAMKRNLKLGENKKLFCKYCFNVYSNPEIRINKKTKSVKCERCKKISRWKLN